MIYLRYLKILDEATRKILGKNSFSEIHGIAKLTILKSFLRKKELSEEKYRNIEKLVFKKMMKFFKFYRNKRAKLSEPSLFRKIFFKQNIPAWTKEGEEIADVFEKMILNGEYQPFHELYSPYKMVLLFMRDLFVYEYVIGRANGSIRGKADFYQSSILHKNPLKKYDPENPKLPVCEFCVYKEAGRYTFPDYIPSQASKTSQYIVFKDTYVVKPEWKFNADGSREEKSHSIISPSWLKEFSLQ